MPSSTESPTYVTSLAETYAKSAGKGFSPLSPDKYIQPDQIEYSVKELEAKTTEELAALGISVDDVLDKMILGEDVLTRPEKKLVEVEKALEWATNYWDALNISFENRLKNGTDKSKIAYADVRVRALGVTRFLDALSDYTDGETYSQVRDVLTTACDIYILAEANTFGLNIDSFEKSKSVGRAVDLGMHDPATLDKAIALVVNSNLEKVGLTDEAVGYVEGIKAECLAGMIIEQYDFPASEYDISFKKANAHRDVREGADFILSISEGRHTMELATFDIKKAKTLLGEGSCRLVLESGNVILYEGDHDIPSKRDIYAVDELFEYGVKKHNVMGIVTRLPRKLVENYTVTELAEMDNGSNLDYNDAKSHIFREIGYVIERIGNQ